MNRILLIEDEPALRMLLTDNLEQAGYEVASVADGDRALHEFGDIGPDLVILDVMLPGQDGYAIARALRMRKVYTPILFLTAKARPADVVRGFEAGGNDYLKKPFGLEELMIRVKVLLNRDQRLPVFASQQEACIALGSARFDPTRRQVILSESGPVQLTLRESDLLYLLVSRQGQVVHKSQIMQNIWGDDHFLNSRSLDVFISRLRKYLKAAPEVEIVNQRGVGYMLIVHGK